MRRIFGQEEIEAELRKLMRVKDWAFLDCGIAHFESFKDVYGSVAGDEVSRFTALIVGEVIDEVGTPNDVLGRVDDSHLVVITTIATAPQVRERLKARFNAEALMFYSSLDKERGYIIVKDQNDNEKQVPLMKLAIGMVTPDL